MTKRERRRRGRCRRGGACRLPGDEGVQRAEGAAFAGQGEDVGGGAFAGPVPGGQDRPVAELCPCLLAVAAEPVVEEAQGRADAPGNGRGGAVGRFRLGLVQDRGGQCGVAVGDRRCGQPQCGGGEFAGLPDRVKRAMLCRSTARSMARCRVSRSGTSMLPASMPSSASSGASSRSVSLAMPGLNWIPERPGGGSGLRRRMSGTRVPSQRPGSRRAGNPPGCLRLLCCRAGFRRPGARPGCPS